VHSSRVSSIDCRVCVFVERIVFSNVFICVLSLSLSPQLSSKWCAMRCAPTAGAGARGPTSVFPADISDEVVPAWSPAAFSTGEWWVDVCRVTRVRRCDTDLEA